MERLSPVRPALAAVLLALAAGGAVAFDVPPARAHVTDLAGVIPDETERRMEAELVRVARDHRVEIAVLTVPGLDGETVDSAAQRVFDTWKMGRKGDDRGALLLVAPTERKVRLQVGYGLEGDLPDGKVGALLDREVLPLFRSGDFGGGILNGVHAMLGELKITPGLLLDPPRPVRRRGRSSSPMNNMFTLGLVIFVFVMCVASPTFRAIVFDMMWYSTLSGGGYGHRRNDHFGSYSGGSGFGGFGGGSSGGGGASRGW